MTGRRGLAAVLALWFGAALVSWAADEAAARPAEADKPALELTWEAPVEEPRILEAVEVCLEADAYRVDIPLNRELQSALRAACEDSGVSVCLALGLIEEESGFDPDAVSSKGAYGLCQLNPKYFPENLMPAENLAAGVAWLGELLERHGDAASALRAYNLGYDDGDRVFSNAVLAAADRWQAVW